MPYYSVEDFDLPYPTWSRPLRRIRRGAMTAFVDKASGELVAGYSYQTCLYAVVESAEYPTGQLFENLTTYSVTTSGKHSWPLYCMIAKHLVGSASHDWVDGDYIEVSRVEPSAPKCEAIDVPQGTTAAELVVRCRMQLPVDVAVAARKAKVDAYNAAVDAGVEHPSWPAEAAQDDAQRMFWRTVREACDEAERAERAHSVKVYGDEYLKRRQREARARDRAYQREQAERDAERDAEIAREALQPTVDAHIARVAAALEGAAAPAEVNGLPPGCIMLDGKIYGRRG